MNEGKAYLLAGETGEYSDHRTWYLRVFLDKASADALCAKLNAWCLEHGYDKDSNKHWEKKDHPIEDENFDVDYTGTSYSVCEIPLDSANLYTLPKA